MLQFLGRGLTCQVQPTHWGLRTCPGHRFRAEPLQVVFSPVHLTPGSAQVVAVC